MDPPLHALIASLKQTLAGGDAPSELPRIARGTNRGQKLAPGAAAVSCCSLNPRFESIAEVEDAALDEPADADADAVLRPIADPAEVSRNPVFKQVFESKFPAQLARDLLDQLVVEKEHLASCARLLAALLGDDDELLVAQVRNAAPARSPYPLSPPTEEALEAASDPKWVFEAPSLACNPDLGLAPATAQQLREKLQIAVQYYEEYIACLTQVRMGLTRTQRLRRRVLNWCRELNNEDYVKADLDAQNGNDNAGLGEMMPKDRAEQPAPAPPPESSEVSEA